MIISSKTDNDGVFPLSHTSSYINFNGTEFAHYGYMATRHVKFNWSKYLSAGNINTDWKFVYPDRFESVNNIAQTTEAIFFYYRVQ